MRVIAAVLALTLTGCQTTGYTDYANAMARVAEAQASVAREQAQAMERLASFGADPTTRTVAVLMLAMGAQNSQQKVHVAPPINESLEWARVLVPSLSMLTMGYFGYRLGVHQSDNNADVSIAGYNAMNGIANSGFATVGQFKPTPIDWTNFPVTNRTTTTTTTNIDVSNRDGLVVVGGDGTQNPPPVIPATP
jgi:hypothetical protein